MLQRNAQNQTKNFPGKSTGALYQASEGPPLIPSSKMGQSAKRRPRPRPLETFGAMILAMVHVLYTRIQSLKYPASSLVQKLFQSVSFFASMTSPFHRHMLTILSVADDHILAMQDAVETYFPSSTFAFLKISYLLIVAESLPRKLDGFLEKLPNLMNRVAWLDWILIHAIYWLDALVNVLSRWRDMNKGMKEKDITVVRSFSRAGSISEDEMKLGDEGKKVTYKEALQRGSTGRSSNSRDDPILDLFETGWIQNPIKRSSRSADSLTFSAFDSYSTTTT